MGFFDDIFGGQESEKPVPLEPQWQIDMRQQLASQASPLASQYLSLLGQKPPATQVAGMSGPEQSATQQIMQYLNSPGISQSPLYGTMQGGIEQLFQEAKNPFDNTYVNALKSNLLRELENSIDLNASRSSASDRLFGGGRLDQERQLTENYMNNMTAQLGALGENAKNRMAGSLPNIMSFMNMPGADVASRATLGMGPGALGRQIQQAQMDAPMTDWRNYLTQLGIPLQVAQGLSTYQPPYYQPTYGSSPFSSIMGGLAPVFGAAGQAGSFGNLFGLGGSSGGLSDAALATLLKY